MEAAHRSAAPDLREVGKVRVATQTSRLPVHVVLTTYRRQPRFRESELAHAIFSMVAARTDTLAVCLMPDRLHWLLEDGVDLGQRVGRFKGFTTYLARRVGLRGRLWQREYQSRPVRRGEELRRAAGHILQDPVRRGLVREAREYPYRAARISPADGAP